MARRLLVLLAASLFWVGAVTGFLTAPSASGGGADSTYTVITLALANGRAVLTLAAGVVTLGATTFVGLVSSGYLFGAGVAASNLSVRFIAYLVPHGIIEFPALWLAGAAGLRAPLWASTYLRDIERPPPVEVVRRSILDTAFAVVLITVAAVIELHITPVVADVIA